MYVYMCPNVDSSGSPVTDYELEKQSPVLDRNCPLLSSDESVNNMWSCSHTSQIFNKMSPYKAQGQIYL